MPGLHLQQRTDLTMTADLRQAIEMLALSGPEVTDLVAREVADNPCLEYEDNAEAAHTGMAETQASSAADTVEWDAAWDNWAIRGEGEGGPAGEEGGGSWNADEEGFSWENRATQSQSLPEFLNKQFEEVVESPKLRMVARFLIDAIDDAGYLRADMAAVAAQLRVPEDLVDDARAIIQTLEPVGIGAQSLAECLRLQLHARGQLEGVCETCLNHLDKVAARDWKSLAKLATAAGFATDEEEVRLAVAEIQKCNPKPAAELAARGIGGGRIDAVTPDLLVTRTAEGGWEVSLNAAAFPRLLTIPPLSPAGAAARQDDTKKYLNERFGRAKWLHNALEQRARTTLAIGRAILVAQPTFFEAGIEFLQPLTLRDVAEKVGVHESTASRVVSGKFMATPWGVVPLRQFFASGVASTGGQVGVSSTSVQSMIAKLVKGEDPRKPLSDEQIVTKLKGEGVDIARRTVAKYRGILNIPGTSDRRVRA